MNRWGTFGALVLFLVLLTAGALVSACGSGGTADDPARQSDDDDNDDDSAIDDDTVDDDTADDDDDDDDDDNNDDDDDDNDNDDNDTAPPIPPSLKCELPADPGSILPNLVGGGAIVDTIHAYVYDDVTCLPLEGVSVFLNNGAAVLTDATGLATLTVTGKAAQTVTAIKYDGLAGGEPDYRAWTYRADAAYMYFRLPPYSFGDEFADSAAGQFTVAGDPLSLTNPSDILQVFTDPIYVGAAIPGISRGGLLGTDVFFTVTGSGVYDYANLLAAETFPVTYNTTGTPKTVDIPANLLMPEIDLAFLTYSFYGVHEVVKVPVKTGAETWPIEGVVAALDLGMAVPDVEALVALIACLAAPSPDLWVCLGPLAPNLLAGGVNFTHLGAVTDWNGTGAPDVPVVESATAVDLTVSNLDPNYDYLALGLAEVPNRALLPAALRYLDAATVPLSFAELTDAQYIAAAGVTDLFVNEWETFNFSLALQYTYDLADWAGGISFDAATDFLPLFDLDNTYYDDSTATVHWALDGAADAVDAWLVVFFPAEFGAELVVVLSGDASSYTPPAELFNVGPSESDVMLVAGLDLPADVNVNSFDPTTLLANNFAAITFWSNTSLLDLLGGILP